MLSLRRTTEGRARKYFKSISSHIPAHGRDAEIILGFGFGFFFQIVLMLENTFSYSLSEVSLLVSYFFP